jgi:predicted RNA-binding Zn-ribbon protein involved in translation (DUF1610 family)
MLNVNNCYSCKSSTLDFITDWHGINNNYNVWQCPACGIIYHEDYINNKVIAIRPNRTIIVLDNED